MNTTKQAGYALAKQLSQTVQSKVDCSLEPRTYGLSSRPTVQKDLESPWFVHWCKQLKIAPIYHRKIWEYAFLLQALHETGQLRAGKRGLGFGCGEEPIPSYLASLGVDVTVTDLDPSAPAARDWTSTGQHTTAVDKTFVPGLVSRPEFDKHVGLQFVDMNGIPPSLDGQYDFCWSICAFEHLGSLEHGLKFVQSSMRTLKPGGVAVHTTEFNFSDQTSTFEAHNLCLYQKKHFIDLAARLEHEGYWVAPLSFDVGSQPLDNFVDLPPYTYQHQTENHLKIVVGRWPTTCFGVVAGKK